MGHMGIPKQFHLYLYIESSVVKTLPAICRTCMIEVFNSSLGLPHDGGQPSLGEMITPAGESAFAGLTSGHDVEFALIGRNPSLMKQGLHQQKFKCAVS